METWQIESDQSPRRLSAAEVGKDACIFIGEVTGPCLQSWAWGAASAAGMAGRGSPRCHLIRGHTEPTPTSSTVTESASFRPAAHVGLPNPDVCAESVGETGAAPANGGVLSMRHLLRVTVMDNRSTHSLTPLRAQGQRPVVKDRMCTGSWDGGRGAGRRKRKPTAGREVCSGIAYVGFSAVWPHQWEHTPFPRDPDAPQRGRDVALCMWAASQPVLGPRPHRGGREAHFGAQFGPS